MKLIKFIYELYTPVESRILMIVHCDIVKPITMISLPHTSDLARQNFAFFSFPFLHDGK